PRHHQRAADQCPNRLGRQACGQRRGGDAAGGGSADGRRVGARALRWGAVMKGQRLAVGLMIAQAVLFTVETGMIHHIGSRGSVMQLALLRSGGGVMLVGLLAWKTGGSVMNTSQLPLQLRRGIVSVLYLWVSVFSFARLPFADATAISYTQAAYIAAFSVLILNERITPLRWIATAIGTVGALLIVKPAFLYSNMVYLVALLGTSFNGLAFVLNKYLQRPGGDSELTTM